MATGFHVAALQQVTTRRLRRRRGRFRRGDCVADVAGVRQFGRGFTLLELLVAMAILGILVLIMGQIFHQSSIAWDSGLRKAKGNMSARAALGFMSRELSGAIAYRDNIPSPKLDVDMRAGAPPEVTFRKLTIKDGATTRSVEKIRYYLAGNALMRDMQELLPSSGGAEPYGRWGFGGVEGAIDTHIVATNVAILQFLTPNNENFTDYKLPPWLGIRLGVTREDDVSGVGTLSYGPDGQSGTADDISSY